MKLDEARKLATSGPFRHADGSAHSVPMDAIAPDGARVAMFREHGMANRYNAALWTHCVNHFDEVVAALEKHIQAQRDSGLLDSGIVGADVLVRAKEVKI